MHRDAPDATAAWEAFKALATLETQRQDLRANPFFQALRDTAHARFRAAFEQA